MSSEQFHSTYPLARMSSDELIKLREAVWRQLSQADEKLLELTTQTTINNEWLNEVQQANTVAMQLHRYYAAVDTQESENEARIMRSFHL